MRALRILVSLAATSVPVLLADPAQAQLDQSCTVSALNRTAPVQADGSWVLSNVPSTVGRLRVRATCVENGVTRSGQSDFFTLVTNGIVRVADISFADPEPVPAKLALTAPADVLSVAGETLRLTAVVTLPDGLTFDATAPSTGTNYTVSNPRIATISADGLVTAVTSGTVLVSASNEGALGILRLRVVLSGDSDGDGIPDDFEVASGLDPNNPADTLADPDSDGLATGAELAAGLDPFKPDSDDDGLVDGDEVLRYGTNPLLADTDGDQVSDGLEIQSGSDPLDPASINLGPILQSLTVQPTTLDIVFNTALGEASRRLDVKGRLIDGTVIDIRRRRFGTQYSSSDLTVASFGAEDGVVFAGQDGTATVTVTNGSRSATVQVRVTSFSPQALAFLAMPGFANGVDAAGGYAYVAAGSAGLVVVDVSNPQAPFIAGSVDTPGNANDVKVNGDYAYVADGANGLVVVDVLNPTAPAIVGQLDTPGTATDVAVQGDLVYVADGSAGLGIMDVSDRSAPVLVGAVDTPGNARGVDVEGGIAVVADDSGGLQVIDVSRPAVPVVLGSASTRPGGVSHAADVALLGRYAWVADGASGLGGLRTVDVSEPSTPVMVGSSSDAFALPSVVLDGNLALTADYYFVNAVPIFDVGGPAPVFSAQVDFSQALSGRDDNGNGVAVDDGLVFMVGSRGDITDNGVSGDTGLHIGRYKLVQDTAGIAPEVAITAPAAGASVHERELVDARASATDDIQVASVQFLVDGVAAAVDVKAPYQETLRVSAGASTFSLSAVATDLAGNRGASQPVTFNVLPDDQPNVALLAPVPGSRFSEGELIDVAATATDDVRVDQVTFLVNGQQRGMRTSPPYRTSVQVPIGVEQMTVQAVVTDSAGHTAASAAVVVGVDDDPPPVVAVVAPTPGTELVAGSRIQVSVGAADPQGVAFVRLSAGGQSSPNDVEAPYQFSVVVPVGLTELNVSAVAQDTIGQQSTALARYTVVPDRVTTALGRVVDTNGNPVAGASVTIVMVPVAGSSSPTGTTLPDGTFSIPGVPTSQGDIQAQIQATVGGFTLTGSSHVATPVPDSVTNFGDITIRSSCNCGEAVCLPVRGTDFGLFTGLDCTGEEYSNTQFFGLLILFSWDGQGCAGTILRTINLKSVRSTSGDCFNPWPDGFTASGLVRIYR